MATLAVGGFSGVVVKNSYVASQHFNGWSGSGRNAGSARWLGYCRQPAARDDGTLVAMQQVPEGAVLMANARKSTGRTGPPRDCLFCSPTGGFPPVEPLPEGRWLLRISVTSGGNNEWRSEKASCNECPRFFICT
jgi:nitrogen fixation protein FixH